ncbi:MAG: c-type cytochrome [Chthoniobacterales bacterium]
MKLLIKISSLMLWCLIFQLASCDWMPGYPKKSDVWQPSSANLDFDSLFKINCLACHSDGSNLAASMPLADPTYAKWVPAEVLHDVISNGRPGTPMPAFSKPQGGNLTDEQIDILVKGIKSRGEPLQLAEDIPPYFSPTLGDVAQGKKVFTVYCAKCHAQDDSDEPEPDSFIHPAYLSLTTDQYIRGIIVVGHPELGMKPLGKRIKGKAISDKEIADIIAWIDTFRPSSNPAKLNPELPATNETGTNQPIYE